MQSNNPDITMLHYDAADAVWVSAVHCLLFNAFRFTTGKSYTVLIATVIKAKKARLYEVTFAAGKGER